MRILFITSNRVGDAVLSTGLLDYLIGRYPEARITIACGRYAAGVFARMPNRERMLALEKQPWNLHWVPLWARATARRWDLVVDIRGSALAFMVRAKQRAVMRTRPGDERQPKVEQLARLLELDAARMPVAWVSREDEALAAAGVPTLGLFGPTPVEQYAPAGARAAAVCGGRRMDELSVQAVFAAVERVLAAAGRERLELTG